MKKQILLVAAFVLASVQLAFAVPAKPGRIDYTQPDGTVIGIYLHGDEWCHWTTDESGNILEMDEEGYYRIAPSTVAKQIKRKSMEANAFRGELNDLRRAEYAAFSDMTHGTRHIPVILVAFSDKSFTKTATQFSNMLNTEGYSENGGIGSVRDWYHDQSNGDFDPIFDVYGPVTIGKMSTYGGNDSSGNDAAPELAVYEGCKGLASQVDFSQYDYDGDGDVDMLLMYYAGYNEAEGASSSTIWPHAFYLEYYENDSDTALQNEVNHNSFNGVRVNRYFCTSELSGTSGSTMCRIGTTCHEFGHSLGLPDFYDVDYSTNGTAGAMYTYDPMCSGSYNGTSSSYSSNSPANFTALERVMLGWMDEIPDMPSGSVTLAPVTGDVGYKTAASAKGEYFVYECRPGTGWDKPLQGGMIVYHVDQSPEHSVSIKLGSSTYSMTAKEWWKTNYFNCSSTHPCCYIIPAASQTSLNYSSSYATRIPFPGASSITTYTPKDWDGNTGLYSFSNISFSNQQVTMTVTKKAVTVSGKVTNESGTAIAGAILTVGSQTATTGAAGTYSLSLSNLESDSITLTASADGYLSSTKVVTVGTTAVTVNFTLLDYDGVYDDLQKFDATVTPSSDGFGEVGSSIMAGVGFSGDDLASYIGRQVESMHFMFKGSADAVYVVVDKDDKRIVCEKVEGAEGGKWVDVDLTGHNIFFEPGVDEYIFGYGVDNPTVEDPVYYEENDVQTGGGYYASYDLSDVWWSDLGANVLVSVSLVPVAGQTVIEYNTIANPGNGVYAKGDKFALTLNDATVKTYSDVKWYYDDEPVSGSSVTLTKAGEHTITARLTLTTGEVHIVDLDIEVR